MDKEELLLALCGLVSETAIVSCSLEKNPFKSLENETKGFIFNCVLNTPTSPYKRALILSQLEINFKNKTVYKEMQADFYSFTHEQILSFLEQIDECLKHSTLAKVQLVREYMSLKNNKALN